MEGDVSKRAITVLVILTVIISLLGSLSVLSTVNAIKAENKIKTTGSSQGFVALNIAEPQGEPQPATPSSVTGNVALRLEAPGLEV